MTYLHNDGFFFALIEVIFSSIFFLSSSFQLQLQCHQKERHIQGKILFLHGYTQSASLFYAKTSALRKKLIKLGYKCVYLNGPYVLTPADLPTTDSLSKFGSATTDTDDVTYRAWWVKR